MTIGPTIRDVPLVDCLAPGAPIVAAQLIRGCRIDDLDRVESLWAEARRTVADSGRSGESAPIEHEHWDWRNKSESIRVGQHVVVRVDVRGDPQGLMAVVRALRPGRLSDDPVLYVDYIECAPWNLRILGPSPKYAGIGSALLGEAIRLSIEWGAGGAIGLHSLPSAETFYLKREMTRVGTDPTYFGLTYYEYTPAKAQQLLAQIESFP
jgi:hypothetical protein